MPSVTTYERQKRAVKRMLRKFGGGEACTLHAPQMTTTDPNKPWDVTTNTPVDYPNVPIVFLPTDFRYDMSAGYWPDSILAETREVAFISAPDLPDGVEIREGWQITRQDGALVSILRGNYIQPDHLNKLLFIAQVSG